MRHTLKLNNSVAGWTLLPVSEGSEAILTQLYLEDWTKMKPSERAFMQGESIENVIAHVKNICKEMKIGVSLCGNRKSPTIRLWWNPIVNVEPVKLSVDLKWSCWSVCQGYWDEYAPDVWQQMEAAFKGTGKPVTVNTGPRKEIRYGSVTITKGQAEGYFCTEWDNVEDLADTLGLMDEDCNWKLPSEEGNPLLPCSKCDTMTVLDWRTEDDEIGCGAVINFMLCKECYHYEQMTEEQRTQRLQEAYNEQEQAFREMIPFTMHGMEPGNECDFTVKSRSFQKLMDRIDKQEDDLLARDKEEWQAVESCFKTS